MQEALTEVAMSLGLARGEPFLVVIPEELVKEVDGLV